MASDSPTRVIGRGAGAAPGHPARPVRAARTARRSSGTPTGDSTRRRAPVAAPRWRSRRRACRSMRSSRRAGAGRSAFATTTSSTRPRGRCPGTPTAIPGVRRSARRASAGVVRGLGRGRAGCVEPADGRGRGAPRGHAGRDGRDWPPRPRPAGDPDARRRRPPRPRTGRMATYREAVERIGDDGRGPPARRSLRAHPATVGRGSRGGPGRTRNGSRLAISRRAIDEYSVSETERILEDAGYVAARLEAPPAVAFIDLTGFTRLTEERGDEVAAAIAMQLGELTVEAVRDARRPGREAARRRRARSLRRHVGAADRPSTSSRRWSRRVCRRVTPASRAVR